MEGIVVAKRFEVGRVAGRGGMATVHEARDRESGDKVALKIVEGANANPRFEREAALLARLRDPGIVKYIAHGGTGDGRKYLAMEWLEGTPLDQALKTGPMELADALAIGARVGRALAAAHAEGVVHRDVKPANIILRGGRADDAVLVDFGIARTDDASRAMTATGAIIGTPQYMAPEQVRGARGLDARVDVFSLGCVIFECLAGRAPFFGTELVAVLAKILLEPAPSVAAVRHDVPPAIDRLVTSMLQKDPEARPASAARIAIVIEGLGSSEGVAAENAAPAQAIGSVERRLSTVLLARPNPTRPDAAQAATTGTDALLAGMTTEALAEVASRLGLTLYDLADGSLVAVLSTGEGGADAATRAVASAHALAREMPGAYIAVSTGRAVVAGVMPVGDAIDRAARLLAATNEPGVVVCPVTSELVDARKASAERSRTLVGKVTPCVGRDRELSLLDSTLRECIDEPIARAVLVIAPPGIGKSRLQRELVARAGDDVEVWLGLADPLMEAAPFAFVGDLLRRVCGVVSGEPLDVRRKKIVARVAALGIDGHEAIARRLGEISGTSFDDALDPALRAARRDPPLLAAQVAEAFATFVEREARSPRLVILEDIHWADLASMRLIGAALERARDAPLLVLALARPSVDEVHPKLWEEHRCQRIRLEPLLRKAVERLARVVLGEGADVDAIVKRADGNALFVEELTRACAEGRAPSELPATIAAVTESRLSALPPDARRVLRAAAIIGERFWSGALVRLLGAREATKLDETLRFLEEHELVSGGGASRFEGERELVFRHALVRDAAYAMLTPDDRAVGHALTAEWLGERTDEGALLAHHYEAGGRLAEAARCHAHAAEQALAAQDFATVFRSVARAEECGASAELLAPARLAEADAHLWLRANEAAATASLAALSSLARGSEKWFLALGTYGVAAGKLGRVDALLRATADLEATQSTDVPTGRARAIARARIASQLAYAGELARADALIERIAEEPGASDDAGVRGWILEAEIERGLAGGEPLHPSVIRRARDLRLEIDDQRGASALLAAEAQTLVNITAFEEAVAIVNRFDSMFGGDLPIFASYAQLVRCEWEVHRGNIEPFLALAEKIPESNPRIAGQVYTRFAKHAYAMGRKDEARTWTNRALDLFPPPRAACALGLAVRARLALDAGDVDAALADSRKALADVMLASTSVTAFILLAHVDALAAAGRVADSRAALRTAVDSVSHWARHLGEYRDVLFASRDYADLLSRPRD